MNKLIVTIDIDWASEDAIAQTLDYFLQSGIPVTVFATHHSEVLIQRMNRIEVGLHPFFGLGSSHGDSIEDVVEHVLTIPHNINAFRAHRFATCNESLQAMFEAGMRYSSNVCADADLVAPFFHRSGLLELPVFVEDGGYLWAGHALDDISHLRVLASIPKIILIHPMHFVLNTPNFHYMRDIKDSLSRDAWRCLDASELKKRVFAGRGIRDVMLDLIEQSDEVVAFGEWADSVTASRNHRVIELV